MKTTMIVLLTSLILCGCSQKQESTPSPTFYLVKSGRLSRWQDGYILYVEKRDGTALHNIMIFKMASDGTNATTSIKAETGTVSAGLDKSSVKIVLHDAQSSNISNKTVTTSKELMFTLHEKL